MRFRQDKVHDLADQIVEMLKAHPDVRLDASDDAARVLIGSVILDDLQEEDDIDREADELLAAHAREIQQGDLDANELRIKFRKEIARKRGFVL